MRFKVSVKPEKQPNNDRPDAFVTSAIVRSETEEAARQTFIMTYHPRVFVHGDPRPANLTEIPRIEPGDLIVVEQLPTR